MPTTAIVWFRRDLRLNDNPALTYAVRHFDNIVTLYIHEPDSSIGAASRWWLHHSLVSLNESLKAKESTLIIRQGESLSVLQQLIKETQAQAVCWNRRYEPHHIAQDRRIKAILNDQGINIQSFNGSLLNEPWTVTKPDGQPYKVFTAYFNACLKKQLHNDKPLKAPSTIHCSTFAKSELISHLKLLPEINWAKQFYQHWQPGEQGAVKKLSIFKQTAASNYTQMRDYPNAAGTSHLSPHLAFGEITPSMISAYLKKECAPSDNINAYIRQLYWRDFAHYLLFYFPKTINLPLDERFLKFAWRVNKKDLRHWQQGKTGIPIIDAGMRQLWSTGWMHNRVRMIVASFLCKNLRMHWRLGAQWFENTLVDADIANNTMGWQWVAGCGADAAPYFRIFNPVLQSEKFDKDGIYIKEWVPELSHLPSKYIHAPWLANDAVLTAAHVVLGKTYPLPTIDLAQTRQEALVAFTQIKSDHKKSG